MKPSLKYLFCILFFSRTFSVIALPVNVDSILVVIKNSDSDSIKSSLFHYLAYYTKYEDINIALDYGIKSMELGEKNNLHQTLVDTYTTLGYLYEIKGEANDALKYYELGFELAQKLNYDIGYIDAINGCGSAHRLLGNLDEAIKCYKKCMVFAEEKGKYLHQADANNNIANVYLDYNQFDLALKHYQVCAELLPNENRVKAIAILNIGLVHYKLDNLKKAIDYFQKGSVLASKTGDLAVEALAYQKSGLVNKSLGNYEMSLESFQKALIIYKGLENSNLIYDLSTNIGNTYLKLKKFEDAIKWYNSALNTQLNSENLIDPLSAFMGLGTAYLRFNDLKKSEYYFKLVLNSSGISKQFYFKKDASEFLSEIYAMQGQFQLAYNFHKEYARLSDSLSIQEKNNQIAEMEAKYETTEKTKTIDLLNAESALKELEISQNENQRNYLIVIAVVVFLMTLILYYLYKVKVKSNLKLMELDTLKSRFFTNISHEFRTPLTLILSPLKLKIKETENEQDKFFFIMLQRNANRLLELINQLLDLSKLEAGKLNLVVSKNDINGFIKPVLNSFSSLAAQRHIELDISISDQSLLVYFDKDNIQKILNNLLSNAFKFTPEHGKVSVDVTNDSKKYTIRVKDNGKGIAKEQVPLVFDRFQQLEQSSDGQQSGSGIGLALVKELVELHHGKITVESIENLGSEFTIELPINDNAYNKDTIQENTQPDTYVPESKIETLFIDDNREVEIGKDNLPMVLVVEDNDDLRNYIKETIGEHCHVIVAKNGLEGKNKAFETIPDLIVSDLMMPKMDGIELCSAVKEDEKTSHIPVILLTAKANIESRLEGLQSGADDYLTKPFDSEELVVRVDNLIEQRKKLRSHYGKSITLQPADISITPLDEVFLNSAFKIVEQNISNSAFTIEQFQKDMAMSRMQLHRKLKALTDCSSSEFVRTQRLKRAAQLLETKALNISEVAYSSGFNNLSYFARCFKDYFNISPSEYAQNAKKLT